MRNPRLLLLLLTAAASVAVWAWRSSATETQAPTMRPTVSKSPAITAIAPSRIANPAANFPRQSTAHPVATLAPDDEALLTETIALQRLAADSDLELSARQWSALASTTLKIQAIRHAYEATIARATRIAADRYRIEIPIYATAGDALRVKFHDELSAQLGEADANEVLAQLGARLESHFAGFGVSVQSLEIAGDTADCVVTRTITYWNSVEGRDQLTTRRETSFPAHEDPAGETWRPLLALVGARG